VKKINLLAVGGPYEKIIKSMINPILEHLPEATVTTVPEPDAINVTFFVENWLYRETGTMVFMSHGIADKRYRDGRSVSRFDYVCVSGPTWVDKMLKDGIPRNKILVNGYAKLDPIFQSKIVKTPSAKKRILWAPTHNSNPKMSSYPHLARFFEMLTKKGYEVLTSLHPANSDNHEPTLQKLVNADVVVADSGSTLYEAWALGKQVVFPSWLLRPSLVRGSSLESQVFNGRLGLHANNESELMRMITYGLRNSLSPAVTKFMEGILPSSLRGKSGAETASLLRSIANV